MKGHIRPQGKETWSVIIDLGRDPETGKRRQKWHTVKGSKRTAQRYLADLISQLNKQEYVEPVKITVADYLRRWLRDYAKISVRTRTYESYSEVVNKHLVSEIGHLELAKLQPLHLQKLYADKLSTGLSARTVRYIHAILHRALGQAVRWQILHRSVADAVELPRVERKEMQTLDLEGVAKLLNAAAEDRLYALYLMAVTTGMRQGELLGLRWQDVDLATGTVMIRQTLQWLDDGPVFQEPKTPKSRRVVQISAEVISALGRHKEYQAKEKEFFQDEYRDLDLVFSQRKGGPINKNNLLNRSFKPLLKRAGLPAIRFHDLRHTSATLALGAGIHPKIVQERLGHATIAMTLDTYSHVMPTLQKEAAQALEDLIQKKRKPRD